jgi:hypothetical protein
MGGKKVTGFGGWRLSVFGLAKVKNFSLSFHHINLWLYA